MLKEKFRFNTHHRVLSALVLGVLPVFANAHHDGDHTNWFTLALGLVVLAGLLATFAVRYRKNRGPSDAKRRETIQAEPSSSGERVAQAHCDVPCGIYDPVSAQVAAVSVARFLDQIAEVREASGDAIDQAAKLSRLVDQKETHAAQVKAEIVVIWGDYFKSPQIDAYPKIHELTHNIMMKASSCKQETNPENGRQLVALVNEFAEIFWATKDVATEKFVAPYKPGLTLVRPAASSA